MDAYQKIMQQMGTNQYLSEKTKRLLGLLYPKTDTEQQKQLE